MYLRGFGDYERYCLKLTESSTSGMGHLALRASNVHLSSFYSQPLAEDRAGADFDVEGLISVEWLAHNTPIDRATIYLCGPKPFLRTLIGGLMREGVSADRLRYEFFGPTEDLLEPEVDISAAV